MSVDVLHVINGLDVGGAERSLANLIAAGLSADVRHGVVSLQDEGVYGKDIENANVPLWRLGMTRGAPSPAALQKLRRIVMQAQPQLLQGWMYHSNLAAAIARKTSRPKIKLAWNIRQTLNRLQQEKPLTRWIIRAHGPFAANVDAIIYNCDTAQDQHERLGITGKLSAVIANGVDAERFRPSSNNRQAFRAQLGIPQDAMVIGHAARFHPMKDHATLLKALGRVASTDPRIHFVLAGPGIDRQNPELVRRAAAIGEQRVHLLGERQNMHRLMAGLDILCSSSAWGEGFPNVIVEAMACGIPCVVTDVGAGAQITGTTGRVVPAGAPSDMARALTELVQLPVAERQRLGAAARQRVLDNYAIGVAVAKYRALYTQLLES